MSQRCYITGAGEFCENVLPEQGDYIIAANGGFAALTSRGIVPDMIVGDFDSLPQDLRDDVLDHPNIVQSPAEKDDTDMMLAVKQGLERGCKTLIINGGLGGRLDQTLANIQILTCIMDNGAHGVLLGNELCVTAIKNGAINLDPVAARGVTVSIFSAGDNAEGVTLKGLKYPLENATLTNDYPVGVSNEFTGIPATVSVQAGTLIVMYPTGTQTKIT